MNSSDLRQASNCGRWQAANAQSIACAVFTGALELTFAEDEIEAGRHDAMRQLLHGHP